MAIAENQRERGIKCLVKRPIWVEEDGRPKKIKGGVHVISRADYERFCKNGAVTQDVILDA